MAVDARVGDLAPAEALARVELERGRRPRLRGPRGRADGRAPALELLHARVQPRPDRELQRQARLAGGDRAVDAGPVGTTEARNDPSGPTGTVATTAQVPSARRCSIVTACTPPGASPRSTARRPADSAPAGPCSSKA